jgi:acyl-CoA thioesterase-1
MRQRPQSLRPVFTRRGAIARLAGLAASLVATPDAHAAASPVVTILGDSITAGLGLPAADALPAQLQMALARLGAAAVVRGAGVSGDTSAGDYGRDFDALFPRIAAARHVVLASDFLAGVAGNPRLHQADGLHPNAAGVRIMAARLAPFVARALKR